MIFVFLSQLLRVDFLINQLQIILMKNFQLWLDCQLYTSHLKNLTKIKQEIRHMRTPDSSRRKVRTANAYRNMTSINQNSLLHQGLVNTNKNDCIYKDKGPRSKFCNHNSKVKGKLQMKQNRILQENENLASRIMNVSSVINKNKQIQSYQKYQSLFKKSTSSKRFQNFRAQKLRKFKKMTSQNFVIGVHRAILKIKFIAIPRIPQSHEPIIWLEIYSGCQKIVTQYYSIKNILQNQIKIPLRRKPNKNFIMHMHCSRGLQYISLGQFDFDISKKNTRHQFKQLISHEDSRKHVHILIQLSDLGYHQKHTSLHLR